MKVVRIVVIAALALGVQCTWGQVSVSLMDFARPGLVWHALETEHFTVLYHEGGSGGSSARSAHEVARIAETVYGPITALYGHEPSGKVHIILKDYEDYSNGAAYFYDNKIEIWAPALDSPLRGDHAWLENVVAHEFTHIVQVQAAMKMPRALPFAYLQVLDYENIKRPDVLYGFPDVIVSYPIAGLSNPAWFAEGTAQYQRAFLSYDRWDTHRDMMLRTRVLADEALSLAEMGSFYSKSSLMREGVYNHGYAFTRYLARTYGEGILADLSRALAAWRHWNMERALSEVTGQSADAVYAGWMDGLEAAYASSTRTLRSALVQGELVEAQGHANYYPAFSPDGTQLAYVSSGNRHYGQTSLHVRDLESGDQAILDLGTVSLSDYTCAWGHRLRQNVGGAVTWRPDGEALVYARRRATRAGYLYSDLYEMTLDTKKEVRLTHNARASHPAFGPDGHRIAFVAQVDGSTNLRIFDKASGAISSVTSFDDGTQVSDPVWHGDWIYFARREPGAHGRDVWRARADGSVLESVLSTPADERAPAFSGDVLYYSSDATGIYNIYRHAGGASEQLTQVLGGAFMPAIRADGAIAYAHYQWDGYKIALLSRPAPLRTSVQYQVPEMLGKPMAEPDHSHPVAAALIDTTRHYRADFTEFSFFPVLRLDQYVSRRADHLDRRLPQRSAARTLFRNTKLGFYTSSREMLEGMSLFAGLLVGPASQPVTSFGDAISPSNLLSLERDAFLLFDYKRGLNLVPTRWSPQFSVELYNIRRRVENGLSIEEFPCTACFPDTTLVDLTYALWEGSLYARSKVTRNVVIEAGYRYSPYRVTTDQFFSRELLTSIPKSASRYFIGRTRLLKVYFEALTPHREADVLPLGITVDLAYEHEAGRLLDRFDIRNGLLVPVYQKERFHRLRVDATAAARLPGRVRGAAHGLAVRLRGSAILGKSLDNFYNDYVGGLTAARGYPFYALGGSKTLWFQAAYTMPILPDIGMQVLSVYLDKAFLRVYTDGAAVWPGSGALRRDAGLELRLKLGSYYLLPTALFASATYGLDVFDYELDEGFVTPTGARTVRYGKEWQWHFGVLFGFDL